MNISSMVDKVVANVIVAKKTISDKDVAKIADMTDSNDHTGSIKYVYKLLGNREAVKALEAMEKLQDYFGSMPQELITLRTKEFYEPLFKEIEREYDEESVEKINKAF